MRIPAIMAGMGMVALVLFSAASTLEARDDHLRALNALTLYAPEAAGDREYLGLDDEKEKISLGQIDAEILIVEIFSMYCPHCQKHAPDANKLFRVLDSRKDIRNKVKMIGIGVGNSRYEVGIFKDKYSSPFPMFDDRDSVALSTISGIYTPHYFALRIREGSIHEIVYSKSGAFPDAEAFLDMIVKESGIK